MNGSVSLVSRSARTRSVLLAAALSLLLCGVLAGAAQAVPLTPTDAALPGSDFQGGDGDQDAESGLRDWQSLVGLPGLVSTNDPNAKDSTFDTGSHENNPLGWDIETPDGGVTPGKANFFNSWSFVDEQSDTFLYLAFDREVSGGNVFLAFELNQDTRLWTNASGDQIQCRTDGDIIVSYQIQNDDNIAVIIQEWVSDSEVSAAEAAGGLTNGAGCSKTGGFLNHDLSPAVVQGAINTGRTITNYLPRTPALATEGEELFGEAALNLTDIFAEISDNPCFSFGQISLHGRSSEADNAAMQDVVGPTPLLVRNCTASGTKYHDLNGDGDRDAGEPGLAGFRMFADYDNDGILDAGEPFDDTDDSGNYSIANINPPDGNYSIREKLTAGAGNGGWTCSQPTTTILNGDFNCAYVDIDSSDTPNATGKDFGNYTKPTVIVEKQTVPDGATASFDFTATIPGKASFSLTDGQSNSTSVVPGVYTATESALVGWSLTDITCSGDTVAPNSSDAGSTATFNAQSGETITCVFTNTRDTGKLTVAKDLVPNDDPGLFDLRIESDVVKADASDGDSGSKTLPTGDYDVSELAGTGTSLAKYDSKVSCDNGQGDDPATSLAKVHVTKGSDITCTFTNTRRTGKLTVVKDLIPADDEGTFNLKIGDEVVDTGGDGASGSRDLAPGGYDVSETGAAGTDLAKYDKSISCDNGQSGDGALLEDVVIDSNDDVTCTITNERRAGSVEVVKELVPATDDGTFDLKVDDDVVKAAASDGDSGSKAVQPGSYTVSEDGAGDTSLDDYDSSIACTKDDEPFIDGDGTSLAGVTVDSNQEVVCTITNTRLGTVEIEKQVEPHTADSFGFTSDLPGDDEGFDLGDDQVHTVTHVLPGGYSVTEDDPTPAYDLVRLDCDDGESENASTTSIGQRTASINVDPGETVHCTFTNRPRGEAVIVKTEGGADPAAGRIWEFTLTGPEPDTTVRTAQTDGDGGSEGVLFANLEPGTYTLCEVDLPAGWHSSLEDVEGAAFEGDSVCVEIEISAGEQLSTTVDNTKPDIEIDKTVRLLPDGTFAETASAHVGDKVEYRFAVTNPGVGALTVEFSDPRCDAGTLTGPTGDTDDDDKLDTSETWVYLCTHLITAEDSDPLPNTATVTGTDSHGNTDSDSDNASVDLIHPAIDIEKTGPATATAGDVLNYSLAVGNPGDVEFAADQVVVKDPGCDDQPTLTSKNGDTSPGSLNPGDTWTYVCSHKTETSDSNYVNTATVTGKDFLGKTVTDTDDFPTALNAVLPETIVNGTARLRGPSGCVRKTFKATVRGSRITRVTFFLDGKRYKRITAANGEGTKFTAKISPKGRGFGVHRVTARVEFAAASQTQTRTLRLSFQRCRKQVVKPRFTG
jgi:hypothetical protein